MITSEMAGTTHGMRQQWLGLAKFIFFTECCMPENIQHYNNTMSDGETELCYDDEKTVERAWELTKQIFHTVEELIVMTPEEQMNYIPAFSTDSISQMLVDTEPHPELSPERVQMAFWNLLSAVAGIYKKPKYYQVPDADIGHNFNKIQSGLGYEVSLTNGFCTVLSGACVEEYNEGKHLQYGLALFYGAVTNPEFDWEVHDYTLFGRDELCVFLQRALVTLLITVHSAADPQRISWAFCEVEEYRKFLIPAVRQDLGDMFRSYQVDVDYSLASIPNIEMELPEQKFGMAMAVVPVI